MKLLWFILFPVFASAANLIPNSSFEVGIGRGWIMYGTSFTPFLGESGPPKSFITNIAQHGTYSLMIPPGSLAQARAVWLTNGQYTLSWYARTLVGSEGPYFAGVLNGSDLGVNPPPAIPSFTGTWTRYTNGFTATSNAFYWVTFGHQQPTCLIDAVQLEPNVHTTYAPQAEIECGLAVEGTNNLFFAGDIPSFTLKFWNNGAATVTRYGYKVFDMWNSNVLSGIGSIALSGSSAGSATINLPDRKGWFRPVTRLPDFSDSYDEATLVVYPYASNIVTHATNDWLGGHTPGSAFHTRREFLVNRKWTRVLSVNYANTRWNYIQPTEGGGFTFDDRLLTNQAAAGMNIIGNLSSQDPNAGEWLPTWATNANGTANEMAWSNYCFTVVNRFKQWVHWWEAGPNEPYQTGPYGFGPFAGEGEGGTNLPINIRVATNYARLLSITVSAVTNADPTAKIIAMAGAAGPGDWGMWVWTNLTANIQGWISAVSTHIYPQDAGNYDPNTEFYAAGAFNRVVGWTDQFKNIKPVWNTEVGLYSAGAGATLKGLNGIIPYGFDVQATLNVFDEALRNKWQSLQLTACQRILSECLRGMGTGLDRFIYYDSRPVNTDSFAGSGQPYASDYQQVDRAEIVSLSVATHFVQHGFGLVTNPASLYFEMYAFTNRAGQNVLAGWCADRTNRSLTLSNGNFAVFDAMGNQVQTNVTTAKLTRIPQYFVSGTLSLTQLSNTFAFCTATLTPDVLPPQVSIDIAPSGPWSGDTNRTLFKWTGIDDTWTAWASPGVDVPNATNVVFKWKIDDGVYTPYTQSNHVWISNLAYGNHRFYVTGSDKDGNTQEVVYDFVPPTRVVNVSGTANVGRITSPF